MNRLDLWLFYL